MLYLSSGLTLDDVCGNALLLFASGFETTAEILSYALYFLAIHHDVQKKVYGEIITVIEEKVMMFADCGQIIKPV